MKLTTGILAVGLMTGAIWAQSSHTVNNGSRTAAAAQAAKPGAGAPGRAVSAPVVRSAPAPVRVAARPHPPLAPPRLVVLHPAITATAAPKPAVPATKIVAEPGVEIIGKAAEASKSPKPEDKKWAMSGKRDPFFSPVVQAPTGSGCATGKKCLEIGQINVRGVVKSDSGFIAVVTNSLNKAYFLRENDPVFNGYVVRITGDSVVFQETVQDKLGKPLTREVVKRLFTPAV
jgi:hypothetical protein